MQNAWISGFKYHSIDQLYEEYTGKEELPGTLELRYSKVRWVLPAVLSLLGAALLLMPLKGYHSAQLWIIALVFIGPALFSLRRIFYRRPRLIAGPDGIRFVADKVVCRWPDILTIHIRSIRLKGGMQHLLLVNHYDRRTRMVREQQMDLTGLDMKYNELAAGLEHIRRCQMTAT